MIADPELAAPEQMIKVRGRKQRLWQGEQAEQNSSDRMGRDPFMSLPLYVAPTPTRVDLITLVNGQVRDGLTIESDTMPSFPPMTLSWQHAMPVRIGPFPWNACDLRFTGLVSDWSPLVDSFEKEFDPEEQRTPGDDGLIGVVHTITRLGPDHWQIDFGSAELSAFETMLDALQRCGVESVTIGKS